MTRQFQKDDERRFVEGFLNGNFPHAGLDFDTERPDCWVSRDNLPRLGIEVVTYHPLSLGSIGSR